MIRKSKYVLRLVAAVLTVALVLSGCNGAKKSENTSSNKTYVMDPVLNELGTFPICKETIPLKIMMTQNANIADIYTNKYTKKIEKDGNVRLEFELVPGVDMTTK